MLTLSNLFQRATSTTDTNTIVGVSTAVAVAVALYALLPRGSSAKSPTTKPAHRLPDSLPILGDLRNFIKNEHRFHDWLSDVSRSFDNEPWRMRIIGQQDLVVVSSPDAFEDVLITQFDNFLGGETRAEVFREVFGRSIITMYGDEWYRQRKTAAKFFTAKSLRTCMVHTMHKNVRQMFDFIDDKINQQTSVDLSQLLYEFSLQTFAEVGLGVDLRWIGTGGNPIDEAASIASPATMRRFRLPRFYWKLERFLNVGPEGEMAKAMAEIRQWMRDIINQSIEQLTQRQTAAPAKMKETDETIKSVVELFIEHSREDQAGLRLDDMVDFLLTFVLAAQDTSALTLSWFFWNVARHPRVEEKLREEMASVFEDMEVKGDTYLTTDHTQRLVYLEAALRETMRLQATVPVISKEAENSTVICGNVPVAKGDVLVLSVYAMARNTKVWGPDAAEFKPERWIDAETGELKTFPPTMFATFGAGPRMCIGMKLAMVELRVVAANLMHRYKFAMPSAHDGDYLVGVSLLMKNPLIIQADRIHKA